MSKGKRGPKTEAGRAAVRLNPIKHGVLSQTPVIPLVEKAEDWERLRAGIFEYFDVQGMMEEALADQIAFLIWRRYRVVRFETESIARYLEEVPRDYGRRRVAAGMAGEEVTPEAVEEMDAMLSARLLPGSETAEKVMRYETRIHRFLLQTIHQLLVLQGLRKQSGYDDGLGRARESRPRGLRPEEELVRRRALRGKSAEAPGLQGVVEAVVDGEEEAAEACGASTRGVLRGTGASECGGRGNRRSRRRARPRRARGRRRG